MLQVYWFMVRKFLISNDTNNNKKLHMFTKAAFEKMLLEDKIT